MTIIGEMFVRVLPDASGFGAVLEDRVRKESGKASKASNSAFGSMASVGKKAFQDIGMAGIGVAAISIKVATSFQSAMTLLQTGAGESSKNLGMVAAGIKAMAPQVATTATTLAGGMYLIESAGFHGAAGLTVLKAAAEGAKVGNADLKTVANGVTTVLTDYGLKAKAASGVTSELVETVSQGKTTMGDLAGSLSAVVPLAAAAHLSFAQVAGAMATMTGEGVSANEASQNIAGTIRSLQSPTASAVAEMEQFGLSSNSVSTQLGKKGLTGTLEELAAAVTSHMGPAGTVIMNAFKQSESASAAANAEMKKLPTSIQGIAEQFSKGTLSEKQWRAELTTLPVKTRQLAMEFATTTEKARGFNAQLTAGLPGQTFTKAMSTMTGGASGLATTLDLTGGHMATFKDNVDKIAQSAKTGGKNVQGFSAIQKDFGFQLDQAKAAAENVAITIGDKLIPIFEKLMHGLQVVVTWLEKHRTVALALAVVVGGVLIVAIGAYIAAQVIALAATLATSLALLAMMADVGLIALAVAAAVILIIKYWTPIKDFFIGVWHDIENAFKAAWSSIQGVFEAAFDWLKQNWQTVVQIIISLIVPGGIFIAAFWRWHDAIFGIVSDIIQQIVNFFTQLPGRVMTGLNTLVSLFTGFWTGSVFPTVVAFGNTVLDWFEGLPAAIMGKLSSLAGDMGKLFGGIASSIESFFVGGINGVIGIFNDFIKLLNKLPFVSIPQIPTISMGSSAGAVAGAQSAAAGFGLASGGLVTNQPTVLVGEGGSFSEYVIPTDPAFRGRAHSLLGSLIGTIGMPGMASGGVFPLGPGDASRWAGRRAAHGDIFGIPGTGAVVGAVESVGSAIFSGVKATLLAPIRTAADALASGLPSPFNSFAKGIIDTVLGGATAAASAAGTSGGTSVIPNINAPGSASGNAALGQQMAAAMGWTGVQWTDLNNVEMREAGWSTTAKNPASPAYGIAQFINGPGEYATYGGNVNTAAGQITAFLNYVKARYGDPAGAWAHELAFGWYDQGGPLPPGLSMAYNGTGRAEVIAPGGGSGGGITIQAGGIVVAPVFQVPPDATMVAQIKTAAGDAVIDALAEAQSRTAARVGG